MLVAQASPSVSLAANVEITDTDGNAVAMRSFRGRRTLLVYEDRHSTEVNKRFKDKLFEQGKQLGVLDKVNLVAVAYLKPFDFFPARKFALSHVRSLEEKLGVQIYVDFTGNIARALALPTDKSNIVVLDAGGDVVLRFEGKLTDAQEQKVIATLTEGL